MRTSTTFRLFLPTAALCLMAAPAAAESADQHTKGQSQTKGKKVATEHSKSDGRMFERAQLNRASNHKVAVNGMVDHDVFERKKIEANWIYSFSQRSYY